MHTYARAQSCSLTNTQNEVCFFVLHACACHNCTDNPICQRLPKDRWRCRGSKHKGKKETWVKYSNDRKLLYTLAVRQCQGVPSLLSSRRFFTTHGTGMCTRVYAITYMKTTLWSTWVDSLQPTSGCGLASTQVQLGFIKREFSADTRNPSWTWVQPGFKSQCGRALRQ